MTTPLLQATLIAFVTALALDYKKILAFTRLDVVGQPFMLTLGSCRKRAMTAKQYADRIAIKDPYDLFDTIHAPPPARVHQPIHVIAIKGLLVLEPEVTRDAQDRCYKIPFEMLSDRAIIFADQRTLVKTTQSVIRDLRRDAMSIAIIAAGGTTMRVFIYDTCEDAFLIKVTSLYRQSEHERDSIRLENATLYIVK